MTAPAEPVRFRFRPTLWLTIATVSALAVLIGLGTWQVQRLQWKQGVIADRTARLAEPPVEVRATFSADGAAVYRRAGATGRFLHDKEMLIIHQIRHGQPGFNVITPLRLAGGGHVLVDRGWVSRDRIDPATRPAGQIRGSVALTGVLRVAKKTSRWIPDNEPAKDLWYYPEVEAMAAKAGLAQVVGFVLVADDRPNPGGFPKGTRAAVEITNRHLEYALTWYGLAATLVVIYFVYQTKREDRSGDTA